MIARLRLPLLAATLAGALLPLSGCQDGGTGPALPTEEPRRGELTLLSLGPVLAWDPQRVSGRETAGYANRLFLRSLTGYTAVADGQGRPRLVGDLATGTGTADSTRTRWSFTLRKDVRWQDGSRVTCADVKYGVSRSFDREMAGAYPPVLLDVPRSASGRSIYRGPWETAKGSAAGRRAFDRAVTCTGRTITFRLAEPMGDFDQVVSTPAFAPFKKSRERKKDSLYDAFSTGPYRLDGRWTPSKGGTWVRNRYWTRSADPIRRAQPDRILHREGLDPQAVVEDLVGGGANRAAIAIEPVPRALWPVVDQAAGLSTVVTPNQLVDYLAPNVRRGPMADEHTRRALALATDRQAFVDALGGDRAAEPTWSLLTPALPSSHPPRLERGAHGNAARARAELRKAKDRTPRIVVAYRDSPQVTEGMKALEKGWESAGFEVTLEPFGKDYFAKAAQPATARTVDVFWSNWGADWPSASTVLPPLFDSRTNLTSTSNGRDYGAVKDVRTNATFDRASAMRSSRRRAGLWASADIRLLERGMYVPIAQRRSVLVHGPDVSEVTTNDAYGGAVDLATIRVAR